MEEIQNEEMEQAPSPVQHAIKFGAILGMVSAILTILLYVIDPSLLINIWLGLGLLLLYLGLVVYGGISYRNEIGGYIDFGPAYLHGFIVLVVMGLISLAVNLLLHNVIDPNLKDTLVEASIEQTTQMMEKFGAPTDAMDEALENQRESMTAQFSLMGQLKGGLFAIIGYAVVALITGLIVRRREQVADVV